MPNKKDGYEIGYGKPPSHGQFAKGQSGNPKGRPKGSRNFASYVRKELRRRIRISENGQPKRITKMEALAKQIVNKGVAGDPKFTPIALAEIHRQDGTSDQAATGLPVDRPEDEATISNIIQRIREAEEPLTETDSSTPTPPDDNDGQDGEQP
jgi:hypothetical protein